MSEQFRFDQLFGNGGAIHFHKRLVAAQARGMQRASDQFFSSSAFSVDQNAPIGGSRERNLLAQRANRHAIAVQLRAAAELLPKPAVLLFQPVDFESILDDQNNFFERKRLLNEIKRAEFGGAHRCFNVGVPGNHHHHRAHSALAHTFERLEAIDSLKPYVEKNQVGGTLIEQLETLFARRHRRSFIPFVGEYRRQRLSNALFVVHNENGLSHEFPLQTVRGEIGAGASSVTGSCKINFAPMGELSSTRMEP